MKRQRGAPEIQAEQGGAFAPASKRECQAFTLIELLVVIAIIAILAAILFPVFARARDKARQSACSNNEKQIGTALSMYTDDWDQTLPAYRHMGNEGLYFREQLQ